MGPAEMVRIAELIDRVLSRRDEATAANVRGEVEELTGGFPLYPSTSPSAKPPLRAEQPSGV